MRRNQGKNARTEWLVPYLDFSPIKGKTFDGLPSDHSLRLTGGVDFALADKKRRQHQQAKQTCVVRLLEKISCGPVGTPLCSGQMPGVYITHCRLWAF